MERLHSIYFSQNKTYLGLRPVYFRQNKTAGGLIQFILAKIKFTKGFGQFVLVKIKLRKGFAQFILAKIKGLSYKGMRENSTGNQAFTILPENKKFSGTSAVFNL